MSNVNSDYYFLRGGGEMGELIRAKHWTKTALGDPAEWSQSLRITLGILLNSKFPMFLWWGNELTCFYNDAYRPSLGKEGKHPSILGMPAKEAWIEIWETIKPFIDKVVNARESVWFEDMLVPIYRNGKIEDVYWTFSYSPVLDDKDIVAGVLVTCTETTEKVNALRKIEESNQRFRNTMKQAPFGITILRGSEYIVEMANDAYLELVDKKESDFVGKPLFESLPEVKETVHSLLDGVLYTGMPYHGNEVPVPINRYGKQNVCYFDFLYHPLKEEDGKISGVIVSVTEVTDKVETRKTIEERKRLYETVTQNTPDLVYVFDLNYRFAYANEALLKMWGRSWDDSVGKSLLEIGYEPWHAEMHEREIDQVIATKKPVRGEVSFPHATLSKRIYDYILVPVIDKDGKVEAISGITRDITQQVEAHKQIEESEMRFRNMVEQAPVAICVLRGENYVVEVANVKQLKLWGKTKEQVLNIPIFTAIPEGKGQGFEELLDGVYTTGKAFIATEMPTTLTRNGHKETFYSNFTYEPLYNSENKIVGIISIVSDVTEQVVARKKIEESDEKLRSLIENAPFPIGLYAGREMRIELANASIIKAWGKGNDVKGKLFKELIPEVESQEIFEQLDNVFSTGIPFDAYNKYLKIVINGKEQPYYYNYSFTPVFDSSGKVYGVMNTASDVTDLNLAKKKIEESESNLKLMIHQAPVAIAIMRDLDYKVEIVNKHALELWGRTEQQVLGKSVFTSMPELLTQGIKELLDSVRTTGKRFATAEMPVQLLRNGIMETVYVNFSYEPIYDANEKINGIMTVGIDVTYQVEARKKVEESEKRYNLMLMQSPFAFLILKGKDMVVHLANESMKEVLGKGSDLEGKPLLEVLPELKGQAFPDLLDNVYKTGIPFSANEMQAQLTRNGKLEDVYFNYVYQPYYEADNSISGVTVIAYDVTSSVIANKKIEANEEKLKIVVEASELGTWELNMKTKEPTYSKRYLEILGGYKEDIKLNHSQLLQHLHPDDLPIREKAFKEALVTGYLHYQARLIWSDSSIHWMEGKGKVFYDEDNKPVKLMGTIRDITEEKKYEEELKKSEEQFSTLADNMENLAWLADGEGWIYWYNKRWIEYTGLTLEEMQGWGWQKVHHPDHVERILEVSKKIWHVPKSFELTFPLRRHDGEYRWFLTRGYPVTSEEGKIVRWIGTNTDINEQKKAEEQFKVLADQAPMWVWLTDKEVNILYTNPEVLKFLGISHYTEFTGNMWEQKVHPEDIAMVYKTFGDAAALQQSFSFEFRVLSAKTQQYEWFYIKAVPRLEAGEFTGFIGTGININEQKTFAHELESLVGERTKELEASNIELEKMNKELQSFAYISSHDLQEPLRKIQTFATRILQKEENNLSGNGKDMFNRMQNSAKRMQTLIQDLLAYSRTNTTERKLETTDLNKIIAEVKEDLKEELKEKYATIEANRLCDADINPFQFKQLMHNLIGNSLKFSKPEKPPLIQIKSEIVKGSELNNKKLLPHNKYCHITVSDNGIGFEQQYSEKIFEVFQRLHLKHEYNGTGIGLSIVKKIVDNHHGIITATGEPNKGATFDIYIPAT